LQQLDDALAFLQRKDALRNGGILFLHLRNDFLKYATFETATIQKLM